ncbi:MAG: crotonase/enoyl-CoA hydratase family protein [Halieaceae bacterium]|nr:crotonase/enoyl-CoA hydratase family protein [Halieaceae bacterium]
MPQVDVRSDKHILHLHIVRPEKYNALSLDMYAELGEGLARLNTDPELRVAVVSAEGKHFSAGVELDQWAPHFGNGKGWPVRDGLIDPMGVNGPRHSKPMVMAVQGYCFTWGVEMLLNSEIRIAASDTKFQMLEVQRGLFPCGGASFRLPREIGWSNAQRVLLTGDRWDAEQALRWGMIQEVTEVGQQIDRALELAEAVAAGAPLAVQALLEAGRYAEGDDRADLSRQIFSTLKPVMESEDAAEGVQSFLERRQAVFSGR